MVGETYKICADDDKVESWISKTFPQCFHHPRNGFCPSVLFCILFRSDFVFVIHHIGVFLCVCVCLCIIYKQGVSLQVANILISPLFCCGEIYYEPKNTQKHPTRWIIVTWNNFHRIIFLFFEFLICVYEHESSVHLFVCFERIQ